MSSSPKRGVWTTVLLIIAVALIIAAADQFTKYLIQENLRLHQSVPILEGILHFTYVLNPGAAFSFAEGATWLFSGLSLLVVIAVIWFAPRLRSWWWIAVFAMLLGGTLGNLYDRVFRDPGPFVGHVVDFIHVLFFPGIFNVADIFIVSSMVLFFLLTVLGVDMRGKAAVTEAKDGQSEDPDQPETESAPEVAEVENEAVEATKQTSKRRSGVGQGKA